MNKVIIIHLNGQAYHLEEGGYDALRLYLDNAARQLEGNPDKDEIVADIEQAIADKCRAVLTANRTVVLTQDIEAIIAEMGPVDDGSSATDDKKPEPASASTEEKAGTSSANPGPAKRLYRINEGAMLGGVCNGIGAYFGVDVSIVRVVFLALALVTVGTAALAYLAMMFIIPMADTSAEKAAAFGAPNTAQEFIRRAREGYYEGMKSFGDRHARREWKRKFKRDMRGWRHAFHQQMHENSRQWQKNWHAQWGHPPHHWAGAAFVLPIVGLMRAAITLVWFFAIASLLTTGALFGFVLPAGIPWWITLIALVVLYQVVVWPLRAIRYSYWHGYYGSPRHPMAALWDGIVGIGFLALLVWLADRYIPNVHEALMNLPPAIHQATDAVREWWSRK